MISALFLSFGLIPIPVNFPPHILESDRVHGMQPDRIIGFSFGEPVDQFDSVSAIGSIRAQIMIAVNLINNDEFLFTLYYRTVERKGISQ